MECIQTFYVSLNQGSTYIAGVKNYLKRLTSKREFYSPTVIYQSSHCIDSATYAYLPEGA